MPKNVKSRVKLSRVESEKIDKKLEEYRTRQGEIAKLQIGDEIIWIDKPTAGDVTPSQLQGFIGGTGRQSVYVTLRRDIDHCWVVCRD